jgi:hypothetical protein
MHRVVVTEEAVADLEATDLVARRDVPGGFFLLLITLEAPPIVAGTGAPSVGRAYCADMLKPPHCGESQRIVLARRPPVPGLSDQAEPKFCHIDSAEPAELPMSQPDSMPYISS